MDNCLNYGVIYRISFSQFSSNNPIIGKARCNPLTNPNAAISSSSGIYIAGFRWTTVMAPVFKDLIYTGQEFVFDTNVPRLTPVTYLLVILNKF